MASGKKFILDTNVLLDDPHSVFSFDNSSVAIPMDVLEELDRFKADSSERGYNCREVIRQLDVLRSRGSLADGVPLENGGTLQILLKDSSDICDIPLSLKIADNRILYAAYCEKQKGFDVQFISQDINARVKADVIGIPAFDYIRSNAPKKELYKGWITLQVPAVQLKQEQPEDLLKYSKEYSFSINEFILLESKNNPFNNALFRYMGNGKFKAVHPPDLGWPLKARNPQQLMAMDLLFDNSVQLVSLLGPAGTGKTFLALLAGLHKVLMEHDYEKMLITRPVIPLGPDIGYLPGDVQEKLHNWMQPIYDNMDFITHSINTAHDASQEIHERHGRPDKYEHDRDSRDHRESRYRKKRQFHKKAMPSLDDLIKDKKLSLEAITYMRGRSIPYQYVLIDEVQNLTPHEVKTLISRMGEGSKVILAGDPDQIDVPFLNRYNNGLVVAGAKLKNFALTGTVFLESSERGELSRLAGELL
ncbi:PhoH family protein [Candidatus Dependentiae bacterium]|nr:PhoH family protein [Candidatus Dependentiae bacterium]